MPRDNIPLNGNAITFDIRNRQGGVGSHTPMSFPSTPTTNTPMPTRHIPYRTFHIGHFQIVILKTMIRKDAEQNTSRSMSLQSVLLTLWSNLQIPLWALTLRCYPLDGLWIKQSHKAIMRIAEKPTTLPQSCFEKCSAGSLQRHWNGFENIRVRVRRGSIHKSHNANPLAPL